MLTAERLRELFHYDPETGIFIRIKPRRRVCAGTNTLGYVQMMIDRRVYSGHRLAWLYVYGRQAKAIDHINGVRNDNRIINLREASQANNTGNVRRHRDNKSGFKGVCLTKDGRWAAYICHHNKRSYLGRFSSAEEAHAAYYQAAQLAFGEFARAH